MSDVLTQYGYIKDGKVFIKGYLEFPDREIGVVRESDEQSLQYFVDRFELAKRKVEDVKEAVNTYPNKGSYLMKIIHMRAYLSNFSGLGDFIALFDVLDSLEQEIESFVEDNRKKNTEIKKELVEEAQVASQRTDWDEATEDLKEIKLKWIKTGSAHKEIDEMLNETFDELLDGFFARRKQFFKEQRDEQANRKKEYSNIIYKIRGINRSREERTPEVVERVKALQEDWKNVGRLQKKMYTKLWFIFKKELDYFFMSDEEKQLIVERVPKKTGIERKKELYQDVLKLLDNEKEAVMLVKKIQKEWKMIGRLPIEEDKEINLSFRIVCNEIFEVHFLNNAVKEQYTDLDTLALTEQLKVKIRVLKESIKVDEYELGMFNAKFKQSKNSASNDPDQVRLLIKERGTYINKIKTKQRILKKLQDKLFGSY